MNETKNLEVRIGGNATGFKSAMNEVSGQTQQAGMSFGKMATAVAVGQAAFALAEEAARALKDAVVGVMETTSNLGADTLKLQRQFGFTAEEGSGLIAVFQRFGMGADDASKAFGIFQKHLLNVNDSESVGVKAISVLGVSVKDASGHLRGMNDVLLDVADKFKSGVVPESERAGVAMQLFGRSGKDLIPVLLQGRDGIMAIEEHAKKMGIILTQDNIEAVRKNAIATKDLNQAWEGFQLTIGNAVMPVITKVVESINHWIDRMGGVPKIVDSIKKSWEILTQGFTQGDPFNQSETSKFNIVLLALHNIIVGMTPFVNWLKQAWQEVGKVFQEVIMPIMRQLWNQIKGELMPTLQEFWDKNKNWLVPALKDLAIVLGVLVLGAIVVVLETLRGFIFIETMLLKILTNIQGWFKATFEFVKNGVTNMKDHFWENIGFILGFFATLPFKIPMYIAMAIALAVGYLMRVDWYGVFSNIITATHNIWNGVNNIIAGVFNHILHLDWGGIFNNMNRGIVNGISGMIEGAINGALSGVPGAPKIHIPRFASGVQNFSGGLALVGEKGAELVNLPRGADVISNDKLIDALAQGGGGNDTVSQTTNVTINATANVGMYAGMPAEKREIAKDLWRELVREAHAHNVQLPQIGGVEVQ